MRRHRAVLLIGGIFIPMLLFGFFAYQNGVTVSSLLNTGVPVVRFENVAVQVEIVDTPATLQKGLSGRNELPTGKGMLFVFSTVDYHAIWMKDMKFPIDIIWIDETFTIVDIAENVSPDSYPQSFRPFKPAQYVLEVNARYTDTFGIKVGQSVKLPADVTRK